MNQHGISYLAIIIVIAIFVVALIIAFWPQAIIFDDSLAPKHIQLYNKTKNKLNDISESARIEKWIIDNKLNEYGDSLDTLYAGCTPLFDESTGESMTRYKYLIRKYPSKPWNK